MLLLLSVPAAAEFAEADVTLAGRQEGAEGEFGHVDLQASARAAEAGVGAGGQAARVVAVLLLEVEVEVHLLTVRH